MRGDVQSNQSRSNCRKGRTKAKSCHTCKTRKVKCDEAFPACRRCVSTGRRCDGYGVWGGGSSHGILTRHVAAAATSSVSLLTTTSEDKYYFEWFKCRTSQKVPGMFVLDFWNTLVFQASLSEPAVLHAIIAFSSVHKDGDTYRKDRGYPDKEEQILLSNYSKAINHLKPHFSSRDRSSARVALITCVLFVCVEVFRGHFKTAQTHLRNGLNVLGEMRYPLVASDTGILLLRSSLNHIDTWILDMFSRLQIQLAFLNQSIQYPDLNLPYYKLEPSPSTFYSFNEAWQELERLFNRILHLTYHSRKTITPGSATPKLLLELQQNIKTDLGQWLRTYKSSRELERFQDLHFPGFGKFVFRLLCTFHVMANIMADSCLCLDDESVFDSFTDQFVALMDLCVSNRETNRPDLEAGALEETQIHLSRSVMDIGWMPPLYYTALKCRIPRIRLQAIEFLEVSHHREGIWDGQIAACIARKVMEIEERDFYNIGAGDNFADPSTSRSCDLSLKTLPHSYRVIDVKVDLPDGPEDNYFLSYRRRQSCGNWEEATQEYNVTQRLWTEVKTEKAEI